MFSNDKDSIRVLRALVNRFGGVRPPFSSDVRAEVDLFFGIDGSFVRTCDHIFGRLGDFYSDDQEEACWMDRANLSPRSALATALFECVSPGSGFINFLETVSSPCPTFPSKLRTEWKSGRSAEKDTDRDLLNSYTIDFPLTSLIVGSSRLLAESRESDLYLLTRSRLPSAFLVPFWVPPIMTRKEPSSRQIRSSFPCTPLAYFVLRLMAYLAERAERRAFSVISFPRKRSFWWYTKYAVEKIAHLFGKSTLTDFPLCTSIFTAYIQLYISPSLTGNLSSQVSAADVQWTTLDSTGALIILGSPLFTFRKGQPQIAESGRLPMYEPRELAPVLVMLPFLSEMCITLWKDMRGQGGAPLAPLPPAYANDVLCKADYDITYITSALYRNCLITLRQAILSLEAFPTCRQTHFNNILELWLTLMNPWWRSNGEVTLSYVSQHYEAYGAIITIIVSTFARADVVEGLAHSSLELFFKCVRQFCNEQVSRATEALWCASPSPAKLACFNAVRRSLVLNWGTSEPSLEFVDFRGPRVDNEVAQLCVLFERKKSVSDLVEVCDACQECVNILLDAFPNAKDFTEKWRRHEVRTTRQGGSNSDFTERHARDSSSQQLTEEEKLLYFRGVKRSCCNLSEKARLCTNGGSVSGGHHPTIESTMRMEIPCLIGFTRTLDMIVQRVLEVYYDSLIPRCNKGHQMWLLHSNKYVCVNHVEESAVWECPTCEVVYGSCCRSSPVLSNGMVLVRKEERKQSGLCSQCGQCFLQGDIFFTVPADNRIAMCPDCASRPFKPRSTRALASYAVWAGILSIALLFVMIAFCI